MIPRNKGAIIAAIGALPYAPAPKAPRSFVPRHCPKVANHAPQVKNWRNIITDNFVVVPDPVCSLLMVLFYTTGSRPQRGEVGPSESY